MSTTRSALPVVAAAVLAVVLVGCVPEPEPGTTPSASEAPAGVPTPIPTASPDETPAAALPQDCAAIYSADMRALLETDIPPLNDPGVEMLSTQNATLLELMDSAPTLRCTWGAPSEVGIATNVSLITAEQSGSVRSTLEAAGFGCEESGAATICRIEQRGVSLDDAEYVRGETHALRGELWVATSWLNISPEGYTEDILATVAG